MRFIGLKSAMLAAGLMLAGFAQAAPQDAPAAAKPAITAAAAAPQTAATPAAAPTPVDPMLEMDGAPKLAPTPGIGQGVDGQIGIQPQVTKNGEYAQWMHNSVLVPLIVAISLFVLFLLLWVVFRFRASANPLPSKTAHNTWLEVAWTLIPVIILVLIAVPSIKLLSAQFKPPPKNAITLKVTGNQWYWSYSYPDNGDFEIVANLLKEKDEVSGDERARTDADGPRLLAVDNRVVLPVGVPIRLITTSADVIHSWAVPAFWIKLDAVPGRLNETSFTIEKPGLYFGQCSELCGPKHGYMPIAVQAVTLEEYNRWVVAKGGKVAGTAPAPAAGTAAPEIATDNAIDADNAAADNSTGQ
jgi:cytochrome c oxidase subunit 2